ncbi:chromosome partitioning protein ParA [Vibrio scophthalmi]|uniref:chromosome partitioning protein ParA n=1 Tax=Vibrio scophthalmi TaxID=45658 RepID=UPI003EBDAABE
MKLKATLLATSVALALVGCGSDSSSDNNGNNGGSTELAKKAVIAVPTEGKFIDAKVEGLYFVKGALENAGEFTNTDGSFSIDQNNPNVTFILGNGNGGLVLGSSSGREVITPYEAVGTQDRAVNLARLLLTINESGEDPATATEITIPTHITQAEEGEAILKLLEKVQLDDFEPGVGLDAVNAVLTALSIPVGELVSAEDALKHFATAPGSLQDQGGRGSDVILTHWAKGSNWTFVERSAVQRIQPAPNSNFQIAIHADRTLGDNVFAQTSGLAGSMFKLEENAFVELKGSNDSTISSQYAAQYLTCIADGGEFSWAKDNNDRNVPQCNGETEINVKPEVDEMNNNHSFTYVMTDKTKFSSADESYAWEGSVADDEEPIAEMGGVYKCMAEKNCSEKVLTQYTVDERKDDGQDLQETKSGSYDPITDVYTEVIAKEYIGGNNPGRISESIRFMYPVEKAGVDRYVDFIGTWDVVETRKGCDVSAESTYVFNEVGLTMSGDEFKEGCTTESLESTPYTYAELASIDYWWFTTNEAGVSKATLDQLNTTVRWNDIEEGEVGPKFKINRFSYVPAGKNWDRGVFTRYTLNDDGSKAATVTMQKK